MRGLKLKRGYIFRNRPVHFLHRLSSHVSGSQCFPDVRGIRIKLRKVRLFRVSCCAESRRERGRNIPFILSVRRAWFFVRPTSVPYWKFLLTRWLGPFLNAFPIVSSGLDRLFLAEEDNAGWSVTAYRRRPVLLAAFTFYPRQVWFEDDE